MMLTDSKSVKIATVTVIIPSNVNTRKIRAVGKIRSKTLSKVLLDNVFLFFFVFFKCIVCYTVLLKEFKEKVRKKQWKKTHRKMKKQRLP